MMNPDYSRFQIRQCESWDCHLRFPASDDSPLGDRCPRCGAHTRHVGAPLQEQEARLHAPAPCKPLAQALLDNIRSAYNVGSMFRTADGAGLSHLHLCGLTPTPANPKMRKTALGAERTVPWSRHNDGLSAAAGLKKRGFRLWALEGGPRARSLFEAIPVPEGPPIVLVVGSEVAGIDPGILSLCERVICLPMQGIKSSLNAAVAFGVAVYVLKYGAPRPAGRLMPP